MTAIRYEVQERAGGWAEVVRWGPMGGSSKVATYDDMKTAHAVARTLNTFAARESRG